MTQQQYKSPISIESIMRKSQKCLIIGMGGGGDCISALHVRWALEHYYPHVEWMHGGVTTSPLSSFQHIEQIDTVSAWVNAKSHSRKERLIEAVLSRWLGEKVFLISVTGGVPAMVSSLNSLCKDNNIETMIFIDAGSDSLAFRRDRPYHSLEEDVITLATLAFGNFSRIIRHRVLGITAACSDGDMSLDEFSGQLLKVMQAGGFLGGTFFPLSRLTEYAMLINEVLKEYPTGTALVPLQVTNTPFYNPDKSFNPFINGFQLATFFLDPKIAATVSNDFARLIMKAKSLDEARKILAKHDKISSRNREKVNRQNKK